MATKKTKLDPRIDKPEKKGDIDKNFIVQYALLHGTREQRAELKKCILAHKVERESPLTKSKYDDIELKPVRDKFCELFFPNLIVKKSPKKSFFDSVEEL